MSTRTDNPQPYAGARKNKHPENDKPGLSKNKKINPKPAQQVSTESKS